MIVGTFNAIGDITEADLLNAEEKVAMLVGAGALQATDQVMQTADRLGADVAKAWLGSAVIADDLPHWARVTIEEQ